MLSLEDALASILSRVTPLASEILGVGSAAGRYLREDIVSSVDLPSFDNSAMDGYAVRAADVSGARQEAPVRLRLKGDVPAGSWPGDEIVPGTCIQVFTGSPLPKGADAVVMQEFVRCDPSSDREIQVLDPVRPWENVRFRGEDVRSGTVIARTGDQLQAGKLALIASAGIADVTVGRQPRIGLVATGDEIKEPGAVLQPGSRFESNRVMLAAHSAAIGAQPVLLPLVPDSLDATSAAIENALGRCDLLVTTGGVSVGGRDFVRAGLEALGGQWSWWKIAMKPGKPFAFGQLRDKPVFALPGNPVSAFVTFHLLVRPALLRLQGAKCVGPDTASGVLEETFENTGNRRHFVRVAMDGEGNVRSAGTQASHVLSSLASANGLVDVLPGARWEQGTRVRVIRIN